MLVAHGKKLRGVSEPALAVSQTDDPSIIVRPEAEADITDAAVWYDGRETRPQIGAYFRSTFGNRASTKELSPLLIFAEVQRFVVFSLDGFPVAFFHCSARRDNRFCRTLRNTSRPRLEAPRKT